MIEAASPRLREGRRAGNADRPLPPWTVLAKVVRTCSVDDGRSVLIQVQPVAEQPGPLSGVLEVLRESDGLRVAHGSTISFGVLHRTHLSLARYQDTAFRGSPSRDKRPSVAQQAPRGRLT